MQKDKVLVRGRIVKMNAAAFKIASRHFGAKRNKPEEELPLELQKVPRLDILPSLKKVPELKPEMTNIKVEPEVKPEVVEPVEVTPVVKKVTRKRK